MNCPTCNTTDSSICSDTFHMCPTCIFVAGELYRTCACCLGSQITPDIVKRAVAYSKAHDAEDDAWEFRHSDGMQHYRMAVRNATVAWEFFDEACYQSGLDTNDVYRYIRTLVGTGVVVLSDGTEIPFNQ